jgi:glyoxylate/hydroxypyruvate reductase
VTENWGCGKIWDVVPITLNTRDIGMTKGALAILVHGGTDNWSPGRWQARFDDVCRDRPVILLPDPKAKAADVHYAAVWKPAPGELAAFPNLRVIFNLGAGVDALMADRSLPQVPLVRVAVDDLTGRMTEYVVLHVLMHHRQELYLRQSQRDKRWQPRSQWAAAAISVGIMGLGTLGANAAELLRRIGFRVSGWSRTPRQVDGVTSYHGAAQLEAFLGGADILVCLLPLTSDTRHILDRDLFRKLPHQPARRPGADQRRPRRAAERSRYPRLPRRRHAWRGLARRVRAGAAPFEQPVLDSPEGRADPA